MFGLDTKNDQPDLGTRERRAAWENGGKNIWKKREIQIVENTCEAIKKDGLTYLNDREEAFLYEKAKSLVGEIRKLEGAKAEGDKKAIAKLIENNIFIPLENKFGKLPFVENAREELSPKKEVVEALKIEEVPASKHPVVFSTRPGQAPAAGKGSIPPGKTPKGPKHQYG